MDNDKQLALQKTISMWDIQKSVETLSAKIEGWKKLTVEIARELYIAHEYLTTQKGQRTNPDADDYISYTWADYCKDVGISKQTAHNWLKRFIPAELSDVSQDMLLSPEDLRRASEERKLAELESREARLSIFEKTGRRPEGWTHGDEMEARKREGLKRAEQLALIWSDKKTRVKPRRDYFQEILEISKNKRRFRLAPEQEIAQKQSFDILDRYLSSFDSWETKVKAAVNLQERLRQATNYYAEIDLQEEEQGA